MFEDYCLSCGKELDTDRAYCNEQCQSGDLTSPSLSEASSTFSSPHLQYAGGQDVPALVPSALGRALRAYTAHDRYSASSSSASSTAWSVLTDDDDSEFDDPHLDVSHRRPNALSYARRPSGTNNPPPAPPLPHRVRLLFESHDISDCDVSDFADVPDHLSSSEGGHDHDLARPQTATITPTSSKSIRNRKRNRASLPTYFSMLQINGASSSSSSSARERERDNTILPPRSQGGVSPVSCSSGHTVTVAATLIPGQRPSPPTPKLSLIAGLASAVSPHHAHSHQTPRGRRRESADSPRRLRSASSDRLRSRSPSPARRRDSDEKVADWSSALASAVARGAGPREREAGEQPAGEDVQCVAAVHWGREERCEPESCAAREGEGAGEGGGA
ncbi:hypothetical protein MVEN_02031100 [Mycena venus]|uniref:Uncharacterized protein n=1 Tax=Mycena venus TaxID=2733690 RepID=A0A8H7CJB7_9AGAR|nr:hypothetical protein MVEN_02031100 [Mycena venus]